LIDEHEKRDGVVVVVVVVVVHLFLFGDRGQPPPG
jgi:hypothetical protein